MRLNHAVSRVEAWRSDTLSACGPALNRARTDMAAVQRDADADARIEQLEQDVMSAIDTVLSDAEARLRPLLEEVTQFFDTVDSPSEEERLAADRMDNAAEALHELLVRKVASLAAQARAQELSTTTTTTLASVTGESSAPQRAPATIAEASPPTAISEPIPPLRKGPATQVGYRNPDSIMRLYGQPPASPSPAPPLPEDTVADVPAPTPPLKRFCTKCGGPLDPDSATPRTCPTCGHTA